MVLGKRWLFSIGNGAEIRPLEKGSKSPVHVPCTQCTCLCLDLQASKEAS